MFLSCFSSQLYLIGLLLAPLPPTKIHSPFPFLIISFDFLFYELLDFFLSLFYDTVKLFKQNEEAEGWTQQPTASGLWEAMRLYAGNNKDHRYTRFTF